MSIPSPANVQSEGQIVVANRGSGNISILNQRTGEEIRTIDLPVADGENPPEPMYVVHLRSTNEIVVGDRANNRLVFLDQETYEVTGTAATGAGLFHTSANLEETQLWSVNDIDNTLTVVDPQSKSEIATVALTEEQFGANITPHDVVLDPSGKYAYVTVFQNDNPDADLLVKVDTATSEVLDSIEVGKGPHITVTPEHNLIYALAEGSDQIKIFDRRGDQFSEVGSIDQPGAHGVISSPDGRYTYTSNLPGGGPNGLFVIDNVTNEQVGDLDGVDTPFPVPHNIALSDDGKTLFLTHSGETATQVSSYSLEDPERPVLLGSEELNGLNPFGIATSLPSQDNLIVDTEVDGLLRGGLGNDLILAKDGNDRVFGRQGDDKMLGGDGNDGLRGNRGNDVLIGGIGNDLVSGGWGRDLLIGVDVNSQSPGVDEIDLLRGGRNQDTFVLGDALEVYYDDGADSSFGFQDFAKIIDFDRTQDTIRLHGSADQYELKSFLSSTAIFHTGEGAQSELVGVVKSTTNLDLNGSEFEYASI